MTGNVNEKEIRQIIFSSEEYQQNTTGTTPNVCVKTMYNMTIYIFFRMLNYLHVVHLNMKLLRKMNYPLKKVT